MRVGTRRRLSMNEHTVLQRVFETYNSQLFASRQVVVGEIDGDVGRGRTAHITTALLKDLRSSAECRPRWALGTSVRFARTRCRRSARRSRQEPIAAGPRADARLELVTRLHCGRDGRSNDCLDGARRALRRRSVAGLCELQSAQLRRAALCLLQRRRRRDECKAPV
jgi:hypothetical protein